MDWGEFVFALGVLMVACACICWVLYQERVKRRRKEALARKDEDLERKWKEAHDILIREVEENLRDREAARRHKYKYPSECPHCGAPLREGKCEYCGKWY